MNKARMMLTRDLPSRWVAAPGDQCSLSAGFPATAYSRDVVRPHSGMIDG